MNKLLKNTRNTLSISYTVDKENQNGKFLLKLLKDNLPVKVDDGARILVSRKEDGQQFEWKGPVYDDGQIFLDAQNFDGIKQAGNYFIRVILKNGEIFPSSGKCVLKLQKNINSTPGEFQIIQGIDGKDGKTQSLADIKVLVKDAVSEIPLIKGDKGDKGDPGSKGDTGKGIKNVKYNDGDLFIYYTDGSNDAVSLPLLKGDTGKAGLGIKDVTLVGNTLSVVMDDGTSHQLALPLLKGDPGEKGQDGANVSEITISGNTLFFHYNDGLTYSAQLPLLKGEPGEKGQDSPKISDVSLNGNTLTFTLSDKSTYSVILPLLKGDTGNSGKSAYEIAEQYGFKGTVTEWLQSLKGIKGEKGDPGQNGKDAPKITSVTLNDDQTQIIFHFSDGTQQSVTIPVIQGPAGENGKDGKDAPKITGAKFNADQTQIIFSLSDGTSFATNFIPPKNGVNGTNGKDAPNFTNVEYSNNSLIFTLSDGKTITATLPDLHGKDGTNGKDAPTITGAKVENNKLTFTFSDGTNQSADLPDLKGKDGISITGAKLQDKNLIFTLSDNSNITVDVSSIVKPDLETNVDSAATTILQNPTAQGKPSNSSYINASISGSTPTLSINYNMEPLKLTYDKNYNELTLSADSLGNLKSYKVDFSPIFEEFRNIYQSKLSDITFSGDDAKVVLQPNNNHNYVDINFDVNKIKGGAPIKSTMHKRLIIDTTQLGNGTPGGTTSNNTDGLQVVYKDFITADGKIADGLYNIKAYNSKGETSIPIDWFTYYENTKDGNKIQILTLHILPFFDGNKLILPNPYSSEDSHKTLNMFNIRLVSFIGQFDYDVRYKAPWYNVNMAEGTPVITISHNFMHIIYLNYTQYYGFKDSSTNTWNKAPTPNFGQLFLLNADN